MSLISDSLRRVAEQRAGRSEPPAVPRMLAGQGSQHKKRLLIFLGLTLLLAGAVIGMVVYSLMQGGTGEIEPTEAVSPAPQQVIFEKIPPSSKPIRKASDSSPQPFNAASEDQRTPVKPRVVQVAIEQEPVRAEKIPEPKARVAEKDQVKQVAAATSDKQEEPSPEAVEHSRQPSNKVKVGVVGLQSAKQVVDHQEPASTEKASEPIASPVEGGKSEERIVMATAERPEPARTEETRQRGPVKTGKAGLMDLQSESTASAAYLYRQAVAYQKDRKWQEAIGAYQKVLKLEPMSAEVYNNIGVCYERQGKFRTAAKSYEKAISINPRFYRSYNNLGIIYYKLKDFHKARAAYEKALQLNPGNSQSEINLALVYERLRRDELARRTLEQVLINEPKNSEAHYNLARMLERQGNPEQALTHYRQFLASNSSAYPQLREKVKKRVRTLQEASSK